MTQNNQVNIGRLNEVIKRRSEIYATLSSVYYLPKLTSKACSRPWLRELAKKEYRFYKIKNSEVKQVPAEVKRHDDYTLLNYLENLLQFKALPRTGLTIRTLSNLEWLQKVILILELQDKLGILTPPTKFLSTGDITINPL